MNKTRVHKYIFLLTLLLTSITCFSQSTFKFYDDISIPQTDAWNFVRQGEVSPSMYTGTINLSVPIYEYKDKDFTIPITATYSSNGNMPNQIAGILGPGWNLEIGGSITIETNGIPDYGENVKHVQGFYTVHRNNPFTSHQTNKWWRFMFTLFDNGSGTGAPEILWVPGNIPTHNHEGELDAQPDIFHFRVPGHSGKFHLGFHGDVIFYDTPLNPSGYRLQIDTVPISNLPYEFSKFHEIILTTPDGYRYIFDGNPEHPNVDISKSGERSIYDIITAWHLTRMEAPDGRWASFQYSALTHTRDNSMETEKLSSKKFEYNIFWEVTRSKQTTPEGDTLIYEYTNLRDLEDNVIQASPVYSAMLRRNILTLPLDEKIYRKQAGQIQKTLISGKRCTYSLFPNGTDTLILPVLVETYDLNAQAWKNEAEILSYDQYGNITQLCNADNRTVSYLWSSDGLYLMLQAKGLTLTQVQQYITQGSISAQTGIPAAQEASLRSAFKNAEITTIKYLCGVGPQKIRDAAGNTTEYTYTRWGKLKGTRRYKTAMSSENIDRNTYSNDNQ